MKSKVTLRELLMAQLGTKRKKRYTVENFKCASAFKANDQEYYDCTMDRSPDGNRPTKEWCYLEKTADTATTWDYCKPNLDYDKLRFKIQEILEDITKVARRQIEAMRKVTPKAENNINAFRNTVKDQADINSKINILEKDKPNIDALIKSLLVTCDKWMELERESVNLAKEIIAKEQMVKQKLNENKQELEEKKKGKVNPGRNTSNYPPNKIRGEEKATMCTIAEWLQEKVPSKQKDCAGMLSYESLPPGRGLLGKYYDNILWKGAFKERTDLEINFDWTDTAPMKDFNKYNFSVEWTGYVYVPFKSKYVFYIDSSGGAEMWLAGKKIISHLNWSAPSENKSLTDLKLKTVINIKKDPMHNNSNKMASPPVLLSGGDKFIIKIRYYHSVHDTFDEDEKTYIKLSWSCDEFEEEVIEPESLYTDNNFPPLKLANIPKTLGVMRRMADNDLAFKNSNRYVLQDLPQQYEGAMGLKLDSKFQESELSFNTNIPINVYIGYLSHYPKPIPNNFENLMQFMSLLEVEKPPEKDFNNKRFEAVSSSVVKLYKKKFQPGKVSIPLNRKGINAKGVPMIVFFGSDNSSAAPISCGGKELLLSDPKMKIFTKCTASSEAKPERNCEAGFSTKMNDIDLGMWGSENEGKGAWVHVWFDGVYEMTRIEYKDRKDTNERNSLLQFEFSDGSTQDYDHINSDDMEDIKIDAAVRSNWVKITIKEVYGSRDNGGGFNIYGIKCSAQTVADDASPNNSKPLFDTSKDKVYSLGCMESVSNSSKLAKVSMELGNSVLIKCVDACKSEPKAVVYGTNTYTKDSAICLAAAHSGVLSPAGGTFKMVFGPMAKGFTKSTSYGIRSKAKDESDLSISFQKHVEVTDIIVESGKKVDYYNSFSHSWEPAVIDSISYQNSGNSMTTNLKLKLENSAEMRETAYPAAESVQACGNKIEGRDCKGSRNTIKVSYKKNIRFVTTMYSGEGDFIQDYGRPFGENGASYGWSRDMSHRIRTRNMRGETPTWENYNNIKETLVEFPPASKSKFCNRKPPTEQCDKATYSVQVGNGKFSVKLFIVDTEQDSYVDLSVNGVVFAKNKYIPAGAREILQGVVEARAGLLVISGECEENCTMSVAKLNMIQISPYKAISERVDKDELPPQKWMCNKSVKRGGSCETGEGDIAHCLFTEQGGKAFERCGGNDLTLVNFPAHYPACPEVAGASYCIRRVYNTNEECDMHCPFGKCKSKMCLAS